MILDELGPSTSTAFVAKMFEGLGVPRRLSRTAASALARIPFDLDLVKNPNAFLRLFEGEIPSTVSPGERQALLVAASKIMDVVRHRWLRHG